MGVGNGPQDSPDRGRAFERQVGSHTYQQSGDSRGGIAGFSKHWSPGSAWEDEMSSVQVHQTRSGRFQGEVTAYNPYERDPRDREAGWHEEDVPFTTRTQLRSQIAGNALARRLQQ